MLSVSVTDDDLRDVVALVGASRAAWHVLRMEAIKDKDYYWEPGNAGFITREALMAAIIEVEKRIFPGSHPQ